MNMGKESVKNYSSALQNGNVNSTKKMTFDPIALRHIGKNVERTEQCKYTSLGETFNMCFKLIKSESRLVKSILFSYGFLQCSSKNQKCNLMWTNTHLSTLSMRQLHPWQRVNHFPRSWMLTRKDQLYESIERASILYDSEWFNFIPDFFCTPMSETARLSLRHKLDETQFGLEAKFIVKPADGSLGRGIYFLNTANLVWSEETFASAKKMLVSRYIDPPYLVNGLKWDLRVYVLVTSFYPLIVYVYSDGLARFAVHKYDHADDIASEDSADLNKHLTNYSLNKASTEFVRNTDCTLENMGHKWTLSALLRELEKRGEDVGLLMIRIEDIVIKSLLSVQSSVAAMCRKLNVHPKCCFELFGFDIMVDEHMKPWLLEINLSPSLTCDSPLDSLLKTHLFCNSLNIAQVPLVSESNMLNGCFASDAELDENGVKGDTEKVAKTVSQDSDQSSSASTAASSVASMTFSSNAASSSSASTSSAHQSNGVKRKGYGATQFVGKMRKLEQMKKICYSAERVTPQYLERLKCYFDKLKSEEKHLGHFNRIFPRRWTWPLYRTILEDCGQEKWDEALHDRMVGEYPPGDACDIELTLTDVRLAHEQLMDAKSFKRREQLNPMVRDVLLAEAFAGTDCYKRRRYSGDIIPFPSALPRIRQSARRRTKSQVVAEEAKRVRSEQQRRAAAAEEMRQCDDSGALAVGVQETTTAADGQWTTKPLSEVNLNVGQGRTPKMDN
uniref:Tubulin--tyrosine ligase-like protein 5 n=1 Tax=Globodera pallida TaxID=36090 RepID=A0A183BJC2_GLOPA